MMVDDFLFAYTQRYEFSVSCWQKLHLNYPPDFTTRNCQFALVFRVQVMCLCMVWHLIHHRMGHPYNSSSNEPRTSQQKRQSIAILPSLAVVALSKVINPNDKERFAPETIVECVCVCVCLLLCANFEQPRLLRSI